MLMTQRQILHAQNLCFFNPERISKVRKSMCRIKQVLTERAIEDPNPRRSTMMKRVIMLCDIVLNSLSLFLKPSYCFGVEMLCYFSMCRTATFHYLINNRRRCEAWPRTCRLTSGFGC